MLSRDDIKKAIINGHLKIYPLSKKSLTGIGYNLSSTCFAFSVNRGILLTVHQKTTSDGLVRYVVIPANDTVLFFSKEYIAVDNTIAGSFHSKVSRVCQGLGHVSTTLDPTWKGQLIISINNPTSQTIVFDLDKNDGNMLTMLLYKLDEPVTGPDIHNNNKGRCDLLLEHFSNPPLDKKYSEKHYQLQDFIIKEFADSLNGEDNFIDDNDINDRYSKRVTKLIDLRNRLRTDLVLINESRYSVGERGNYSILRDENEKQVIRECAIFEMDQNVFDIDYMSTNVKNEGSIITKKIEDILRAIEYELEMIEHMRRIEWQNSKIDQFAGEASEYVQERNSRIKRKSARLFWIPLLCIVSVSFSLFLSLLLTNVNSALIAIIATIYAPILTFALQWWYKSWKKFSNTEEHE